MSRQMKNYLGTVAFCLAVSMWGSGGEFGDRQLGVLVGASILAMGLLETTEDQKRQLIRARMRRHITKEERELLGLGAWRHGQ